MADDSKNTAANTWVINRGNCRGRADTYLSPSQNFLLKEHFPKKNRLGQWEQFQRNMLKWHCTRAVQEGDAK